jgi:RNA polymerase sigma-70 factor (ECF subfamily)
MSYSISVTLRPAAMAEEARTLALVERCRAGDRRALGELYREYRHEVYRTLRQLLRHSPDIDDVVQDVFIQVFRSVRHFKGDSRFSTWLYRVAVNVGLMHLRKRKSSPQATGAAVVEEVAPDSENPAAEAMRAEKRAAVQRILDALSDKKRVVFVLHDLCGKQAKEIADILEISVLTVRTRLHYARKEFYAQAANEPSLDGELEEAS